MGTATAATAAAIAVVTTAAVEVHIAAVFTDVEAAAELLGCGINALGLECQCAVEGLVVVEVIFCSDSIRPNV